MAIFSQSNDPKNPAHLEPSEVLAAVREKSCYRALRGLINLVLAIILLLCIFGLLAGVMMTIKSTDIYSKESDYPLAGIAVIVGSVLVAFLGYAWRQAAVAVIDIADLMVAQRTDSQSK